MTHLDAAQKIVFPFIEKAANLASLIKGALKERECSLKDFRRKITCRSCGGSGERTGGYQGGDVYECSRYEDYKGVCTVASGFCPRCLAIENAEALVRALDGLITEARNKDKFEEAERLRLETQKREADQEIHTAKLKKQKAERALKEIKK